MKILEDLKVYLDQVNKEELQEEKTHLEREINYFINKVQTLKDQILTTNSLDALNEHNLNQEFKDLVSQVRYLVSLDVKLSDLQGEVLSNQELLNQRQAQLFEIFIYIENLMSQEIEAYQDFQHSQEIDNYEQFIQEFDAHIKSQSSTKLYESIKGRISTMHRKATQFNKANQKLDTAKANLDSFLNEIQKLEILVQIQTPNADLELQDTPLPQTINQDITPILENLYQENLEKLKLEAAIAIQKRNQDFTQKLEAARKRLTTNLFLSMIPLAFLLVYSQISQPTDSIQTPDLKSNQLNVKLRNLQEREMQLGLTDRGSSNLSFQLKEKLRDLQEREVQRRITDRESQEFTFQLNSSDLIKLSTPEKIHLYSSQGKYTTHFKFYISPIEVYSFGLENSDLLRIKNKIELLYGKHSEVMLHEFHHNPGSKIPRSTISTKLY